MTQRRDYARLRALPTGATPLQALAGETGRKRTRVGDSVLKRARPEGVFSSQLL